MQDVLATASVLSLPIMTPSPKNLRVLVVDSKQQSRQNVVQLLRDCQYQVHSVKTSKEALALLAPAATGNEDSPFDIILKEHEPDVPSPANACRLLRQMAHTELLAKIPVVVVSSNDEREVVVKCLTLGAIDYLIKPLRHNELRHIWTRVWWWRRSGLGAGAREAVPKPIMNIDTLEFQISSDDSKYTKCDDDEEPTSKEGSAPDIGNGSNENGNSGNDHGSNENANSNSRVEAKPRDANGNGCSGNNGNSATKELHHNGSNGNGNSATLAEQNALVNTAEGKAPANPPLEAPVKPASRSSFQPYTAQPHKKRSISGQLHVLTDAGKGASEAVGSHSQPAAAVEKVVKQVPQPPSSPLVQRLLSKAQLQLGGTGSSSGGGRQVAAMPGNSSWEGPEQAAAVPVDTVTEAVGQAIKASGSGSPAAASVGRLPARGAILSRNPSTNLSSEDTLLRNIAPACRAVTPQVASSAPPGFGTSSGAGCGPGSAIAASAGVHPHHHHHHHHHAVFAHAAGSQATTSAAASMQFAGALPGGPAVWMGQHVALHHLQAAMHGGVPPPLHPYVTPHGYPGPVYPPVPYGHLVGVPQHLLQQMHPQLLRSLYAASYNHGNHGSHATDANGRLTPAAVLLAAKGHELPAAAAAAAATEVAASEAAARGMGGGGRVVTPPHLMAALNSLAPDVAAAAIAAAAGNYNPLMLMQYLAQTGQASPLQLQQLAAVHQAGPAAAAAAWHAAAAAGPALQPNGHGHVLPGYQAPSGPPYQAPSGPVANRSTPPPPPVPSRLVKEVAEEGLIGEAAGSGLRLSTLPEPRKRRAMALDKYRKKRKNLKFAKTIRYESRKQLAQTRPRIKGQFVKHAPGETGAEDGSGVISSPGDDADMAIDCEEDAQARYGGQNFDEEGEYDRDGDDDAMEADEDEEGGAGGSGTEAGDCKRRRKEILNSSPEAELTPPQPEDELPEEDDEVVNSLRKLKGGLPKTTGVMSWENAPADAAIAVVVLAVIGPPPQILVPLKAQQQLDPASKGAEAGSYGDAGCMGNEKAGNNDIGNSGRNGSASGFSSPDEISGAHGRSKVAGDGSSHGSDASEPVCVSGSGQGSVADCNLVS